MSWKNVTKSIAFPKVSTLTTGKFPEGDLVGLNTDSQIVDGAGLRVFPLSETFDITGGEINGALALEGVALVRISVITGVDVSSPIMLGTGRGGILATAGNKFVGYALQKPTFANELIPVLLVPGALPA